jgi:hypothetical protein
MLLLLHWLARNTRKDCATWGVTTSTASIKPPHRPAKKLPLREIAPFSFLLTIRRGSQHKGEKMSETIKA